MSPRKLEITLTRSLIGLSPQQEATARALGLRRINHRVVHDDTATVRGMLARVVHVVRVSHAD